MKTIAVCIYMGDIIVLDLSNDDFYFFETNEGEIINSNTISRALASFGEYEISFLNLTDIHKVEKTHILEERWSPKTSSCNKDRGVMFILKLIWYGFKLKKISKRIIKDKWDFILNEKPALKIKTEEDKELIKDFYLLLLRKMFFFNNNKTDCLTTSVALQHFLAKKGINGILVVGVKTKPFFAHAWIEVDGIIINDDINLRQSLSVILEVSL